MSHQTFTRPVAIYSAEPGSVEKEGAEGAESEVEEQYDDVLTPTATSEAVRPGARSQAFTQAGGVKDAVRDLPAEGGEMDDGTPDDMAAVQAAQSAVQAEAAAEVRAAVAKSRHEASEDYAAAKSGL